VAYNTAMADDIRMRLGSRSDVTERKMFGGIAFMVDGHMAVGVSGDELMVRVGKDAHDETVALPAVRPFAKSGRGMTGWVLVAPDDLADDVDFEAWIDRGVAFAAALPPK